MGRLVLAAVLGAAAGAVGALYLFDAANDDAAPDGAYGLAGTDAVIEPADVATLIDRRLGVADRAAVYQFASEATPAELTSSIEEIARRPHSPERKFLLSALLASIAQDDAHTALELLRELRLDPGTTRALALQLVAAMGANDDALSVVLSALPHIDQRRFRMEAIAELADIDPDAALELALAMNEEARADAVRAVANVWAEKDPPFALTRAEAIAETDLKVAFVDRVLRQMARTDASAAIAYVNARYAPSDREHARLLQGIGQEALQAGPSIALDVAPQIGGRIGQNLERQAVERWAGEHPLAAFAYVQGLPPGGHRQLLKEAVAAAFGEQDPDAALSWARSIQPGSRDMVEAVLNGIARADPIRAVDLAAANEPSRNPYFRQSPYRLAWAALQNTAVPRVPAAAIADRLLAIEDADQRATMVRTFLGAWANQDVDGALDWLLVNNERVPPGAYQSLAWRLAETDVSEAMRQGNRLPPEMRADWASAVVGNMARRDPAGAVQWVAELRGQPIYDASATAVIQVAVHTNPEYALTLFDSLSPAAQIDAAKSVGAGWAQQDMPAARDWIHRMQAGPVRDAALAGLIGGMRDGAPDAATLALFSTDRARQDALLEVLNRLARRDQAAAMRLMDQYITDPELRQRAGLALAGASR